MIKITFVQPDGNTRAVEATEGETVMQTAVANGVDGIVAECGGAMMCATCHCYVDDDWVEQAGACKEGEEDMLECGAAEVRDSSRLSCQITIRPDLDGLVLHLPEEQI